MKILVFGKTGQVATELVHLSGETLEIIALNRADADLCDLEACASRIADTDADAVINAAAFTAVDHAEDNLARAMQINAEAPGAMARAAAKRAIPFLHLSTDYVFDGTGSLPRSPDAAVAPLNVYGQSKLAGEMAVRDAGGPHVILRTAWVFSAHGKNFVKTMLTLAQSRDALNVVDDQIGGPTPARDIAETLVTMARAMVAGHPGGTYHFTGQPTTSWAGFARETFRVADCAVTVTGIATSEYPTPAARPLNSRLDCGSLERDFGIKPADWKAGLARVIKDLEST